MSNRNFHLGILLFLALAAGFAWLHPYAFLRMVQLGASNGHVVREGLAGAGDTFRFYGKVLWFNEPALLVGAALGLAVLVLKKRVRILGCFIGGGIFYMLLLHVLWYNENRYAFPLVPALAMLAGVGLTDLGRWLSASVKRAGLARLTTGVLVGGFLIYPTLVAAQYDRLLLNKDTRVLAKEWVERTLPEGTKIAVHMLWVKFTPTHQAILEQRTLDPNSLNLDDEILLTIDPERYPRPAYHTLHITYVRDVLPKDIIAYLHAQGYSYLIIDSWGKFQWAKVYNTAPRGTLLQRFDNGYGQEVDIHGNPTQPVSVLFRLERLGPAVEVYRLEAAAYR